MTTSYAFVPAKEQDKFSNDRTHVSKFKTNSCLSGAEARRFYENLIEGSNSSDVCQRTDKQIQDGKASGQRVKHMKWRQRRGSGPETSGPRHGRSNGDRSRQSHTNGAVESQMPSGGRVQTNERTGERSDTDRRTHTRGRTQDTTSRPTELQGLKLLRCAQEGDLPGMRELLSRGVDINFQDPFFWTAVMCASWEGQRAAVRLLLQRGAAWVGVVDLQGRDARDLAMTANHKGVLEELDNFGTQSEQDSCPDSSAPELHRCDVCKSQYSGSLSSHLSSTLHQFSLRRPAPTPQYCLPSSSTSYRMMVRSGWDPRTGLGPAGEGSTQPVSTVLKRDQKGLGFGPTKRARVTHFSARDPQAVKRDSREGCERKDKRREERRAQRDKNWERDFRASFYL